VEVIIPLAVHCCCRIKEYKTSFPLLLCAVRCIWQSILYPRVVACAVVPRGVLPKMGHQCMRTRTSKVYIYNDGVGGVEAM